MAKTPMTRADMVRARRKLEPIHPKQALPEEQVTARDMDSLNKIVTRRQSLSAEPISQANAAKKSVYVRTSKRGNEIRLPALPRVRIPWRALSGLIVIACLAALYVVYFSDTFRVHSINLAGTNRLSNEAIMQAMKIKGSSMMELNPSDLRRSILSSFPEIRDAEILTRLPNQVDVLVVERQPLITWFLNDKPAYWIDEQGYSFPIRGENIGTPYFIFADSQPPYPVSYPMNLRINSNLVKTLPRIKLNPSVDPDFVNSVLKLTAKLPESYTLGYEKAHGLAWKDPHGWTVYFGDRSEQMDQKLVEYDAVLQTILDKNLQPSMVSMQFLHAPYLRTE